MKFRSVCREEKRPEECGVLSLRCCNRIPEAATVCLKSRGLCSSQLEAGMLNLALAFGGSLLVVV